MADGVGVRVLLRLLRGGEANQYYPGLYGHDAGRAVEHAEQRLSLTQDLADHAITWVRQQKALARTSPSCTSRPGRPTPHHVPQSGPTNTGEVRRGLGQAARAESSRGRKARRDSADAELTARHEDPGVGRHARRAQAGARPADGEIYAGFARQTDYRGGASTRRHRLAPVRSTTPWSSTSSATTGASAERTPVGCFQRDDDVERDAWDRDHRVPDVQDRRPGTPEGLQPLRGGLAHAPVHAVHQWTKAGRLRTGVAPATAPSCDGATDSATAVDPPSVPPRDRHHPDHPQTAGISRRSRCNASIRRRWRGVSMLGSLRSADARRDPRRPVLRDHGQSRNLLPGLDGGHQAPHAVEMAAPLPFDEDVGGCMDLGGGRNRDLSTSSPSSSPYLQRAVVDRSDQYGVTCRSTTARSSGSSPSCRADPSLIRAPSQLMFSGMRLPRRPSFRQEPLPMR